MIQIIQKNIKKDILYQKIEEYKKEKEEDKIVKPYKGYMEDTQFKKLLIISHSGFISEVMNCLKIRNEIKILNSEMPKYSSLYVIRIYCVNCVVMCENKINCNLKYNVLLVNDISHLEQIDISTMIYKYILYYF